MTVADVPAPRVLHVIAGPGLGGAMTVAGLARRRALIKKFG